MSPEFFAVGTAMMNAIKGDAQKKAEEEEQRGKVEASPEPGLQARCSC